MISYKHTQTGYLMIIVMLAALALFVWLYITASQEPVSVDSGPNFAITSIMVIILFILGSFATLTVLIDEKFIHIKFGYGIFQKKISLSEIASLKTVKNPWYYGWGIKLWLWPKTWIYNVSGFGAVELIMKNGNIYRIGTDEPAKLEAAIQKVVNK